MKYSHTYLFYPGNKALEHALADSIGKLGEGWVEAALPDTKITVADNFLYTRGNYEQYRFSANILSNAREALEAALGRTGSVSVPDEARALAAFNFR